MHARATNQRKVKFVKEAKNNIKTKRAPRAADDAVCCGSAGIFDRYMITGVGQNLGEVWTRPIREEEIETIRNTQYFLETIKLDK